MAFDGIPSRPSGDALNRKVVAAVSATLADETGLSPDQCDEIAASMCDGQPWQANTALAPKRRCAVAKGNGFVLAFVENMVELTRIGLTAREWEVLAYILKAMEFGNLVELKQRKAAADFGVSPSTMAGYFKTLRAKGVLVENEGHMYINSNLFMKGLASRMSKERADHLHAASNDGGRFKRVMTTPKKKATTGQRHPRVAA